jgi:hypothetical protein
VTHEATIDESTRRRAAVEASCDVRTIDKVVRGEPVRGLAGERARAALISLGVPVPAAPRWRPTRR